MKKKTKPAKRQIKSGNSVPKKKPVPERGISRDTNQQFPIVGIGASAGGLEALELFLNNVPAKSGMAFVIVQHLDPTHKGIMVELLKRFTPMTVVQVKDLMQVNPDSVYVIPPNKDLSILHGKLHLFNPTASHGLRLPIDFFFRSLADDLHDKSIGVILSGMGSDGTLGLRAIKEKAGSVFVQAPASAKFDGMPRSVIEAGLADVIAPVEELPGRIIDYLNSLFLTDRVAAPLESKIMSALDKIFIILRTKTGHDFSQYKKSTVYRRIERRMGIHQIDRIEAYVRFLQENSQEAELFFRELLIGVTSFFRNPEMWEHLKVKVLPELLSARKTGGILRAWIPGCSTGEEAYSLAIIFREAIKDVKPVRNFSLQIFATDLDKDAIDNARAGIYPANIAADVSPARMHRFFVQEEGGLRVSREIREMVIFAPQNVIMDPPFTKIDILICRNLLIYLTQELQKKLLPLFHYSLNPGGVLFLGSAETIGAFTGLFKPMDDKMKIYRKLAGIPGNKQIKFPSIYSPSQQMELTRDVVRKPYPHFQEMADKLILQEYAPAAALTNDKGDILYISGRTGKYLEPAAGKVNWNLFVMAQEGLRYKLPGAFRKAIEGKGTITIREVKVKRNGGVQAIDISIRYITDPGLLSGMLLTVFTDAAKPTGGKASGKLLESLTQNTQILELERELMQANHEIQTTREEMQASQEELKSLNEELQSANEELQSTNEELTTSKEEMQSMNEELQTVNNELQAKVNEYSNINNDMKNLLDSTDIATLFLDETLKVRRFTSRTSQIIKLIPGDVGRPITDIVSDLVYPELEADAHEVMQTLIFVEKQIATTGGRCFQVRIMPYHTIENRIDGLVITFTEITESKKLESELSRTQADLKKQIKKQKTKN
ncbi:MAG: two-component system, chemotaxis family, CheB/CheR fusion protein [Thermodesulfobacteriota bacterium]|nr:two-component system, chemotaxis family, CheB/CheR fusion protein [Thermodesulfobacteriota bacterium]